MAEGWTRALHGDRIEPYSAGVQARGLDARAVAVMSEAGVDIGVQRSKHVDELRHVELDLVVTLCDDARESCPAYLGSAPTLHESFDDPPYLARNARSEEEALPHYRRVRDEIKRFVEDLPDMLQRLGKQTS